MKILLILVACAVGQMPVAAQENNQPKGKLSGLMFGDYYYNISRDGGLSGLPNSASASAAPGPTSMQAFQFRRIYLTYDYSISDQFVTRLRFEADQGSDLLVGGKISDFVKDAYITWKNVFSGSNLTFGIQPPPAYEISEAAWGYRSLEKTLMDLRSIVSSRDQGLSLKGRLAGDGVVNYWMMIGNNSANTPASAKYKRYYAQIHLKPSATLQATLYGDYKAAPDIADPYHAGQSLANGVLTTALFIGSSEKDLYSVGAEGFVQSTSHGIDNGSSLGTRTGLGLSVFGWYAVRPELAVVARYDHLDPNTDASAGGDVREYIIGGIDWKVEQGVSVIPNLLVETYQAPAGGKSPDASVTARLTVFYTFL